MHQKEIHKVENISNPQRLQEYGVGLFQQISTKSALKKALKKNLLSVNGKIANTATLIVGGELIEYRPIENKGSNRLILSLEVVYEDDDIAVINKPAGILVSGNGFKTVANALAQNLSVSSKSDAVTPQPVHRLDYATTGLLLVGKTSSSIIKLNRLFEQKKIVKTYYAVTIGQMKKSGTINVSIDSKMASSSFEVLKTVVSERFSFLNLVMLSPHTGRRHQLRKHLFGLGNPILGDADYFLEGLILKGKGLYLHGYSLHFKHPFTNQEMELAFKLPKKFYKIFNDISIHK